MTPEDALIQLRKAANPQKAVELAAYHKVARVYLGLNNPSIDLLCKAWKANCTPDERMALAHGLWRSNIHEARVGAAKLMVQTRIEVDEPVWTMIAGWVHDFDAWAIADHAAAAGSKRLLADPSRLDLVETWTSDPNMWVRRAALVMTLPWSTAKNPDASDLFHRERILGWAAGYTPDQAWFIQKAIGWWLRSLSKQDPARVRDFLADHGDAMKAFARKEASKYL